MSAKAISEASGSDDLDLFADVSLTGKRSKYGTLKYLNLLKVIYRVCSFMTSPPSLSLPSVSPEC